MNFNDIQSAWNNDPENGGPIPTTLEQLKPAGLPLDKIKKNLRNEFVYQVLSIIFLAFLPQMQEFAPGFGLWFYVTYGMFVSICAYYLIRLWFFYQRISNYNLNTKDSLYETYYDIRLNIEMYKTFSFSLMPFILIFIAMYTISVHKGTLASMIQTGVFPQTLALQMAVAFIVTMIVFAAATEWWTYSFYGKYAKEIRNLLDKLKEE